MLRLALLALVSGLVLLTRSQIPPGGHHPVKPDDPSLQPAIAFAAATLNAECDKCKYCQTVVQVANATIQMVDGTIYQFAITMQESDQCLVEECMGSLPDDKCTPNPQAKAYVCDVDVVIRNWASPTHVMRNVTCLKP